MPVSCALGQACDLNTQICPGTRGGLLPSAGQLGECRPLLLQSRLRSLLSVLLKAQHSGNKPVQATIPGLMQP